MKHGKVLHPRIMAYIHMSMRGAKGPFTVHEFPMIGLTCIWF